jgi:Tfp pilus assembly protein PilN
VALAGLGALEAGMTPPRLSLDFARSRAQAGTLATVVAAAGAVAALLVAGAWLDARQEQARWESRLEDTRRLAGRALPRLAPEAAASPQLQAELQAANAVLDQMSLGWGGLLDDVEAAVGADVALLALQPDARGRSVTIEGEARQMAALLELLTRLEATGSLEQVHLVQHETRVADPRRPVAFKIQARWTPGA